MLTTIEALEEVAGRRWRGLPGFWQKELRVFREYEALVDQELTIEGLELWLGRVEGRLCPVAGAGCKKPVQGRFCEFHREQAHARGMGWV